MALMDNSNIPHELVFDILKRLPAKSLMRFRCVSKSFSSLPLEPLFIEAHRKSHVAHESLVCYIALEDKDVIYNLGEDDLGSCVTNCPFEYLNDRCFRNLDYYSESINGIICLWNDKGDTCICNPFIREHVFLPNTWKEKNIPNSLTCSLGFDPTIKKFIVLKANMIFDDTFQVSYSIFTIGVDKLWRKAYVNIPNFFPMWKESVCVDGVIYFVNFYEVPKIVAFSVEDEKVIRTILYPDEVIKLLDVKGQFAILVNSTSNIQIMHLLVLQNETILVKQSIELPSQLLDTLFISFFTNNLKGELLSLSICGITPLFIYDIGRKDWRIVEICEIQERKNRSGNHFGVKLNNVESI